MAPLKVAAAVVALAFAAPCDADALADWRPYVVDASLRFGVPTSWIERVIRAESRGQTMQNGLPIRSRAGAIGLMQLMPGTWEMLRGSLRLGRNPDDPHDNILAGTLYLRMMYERFGYPGLFAAYNAGPQRLAAHLAAGRPLPGETIAYLRKVTPAPVAAGRAIVLPAREILFAVQYRPEAQNSPVANGPVLSSLFAVRDQNP